MKIIIDLLTIIKNGILIGVLTPNLPSNILKIHTSKILICFRYIVGFSSVALLGGKLTLFPVLYTYIAISVVIIHFIYILYISLTKFKYMVKIIKNNQLGIIKTNFDKLWVYLAIIIYFTKMVLEIITSVSIGLGVLFMLGVDNIFDMLNKIPVFRPYFNSLINLLNPRPGLDYLLQTEYGQDMISKINKFFSEIEKPEVNGVDSIDNTEFT
jgi:hypothetical protein